jgi:sarcosine oxidase subunit beta
MADVVVVGGGISGLASAWALARAGLDVILVERYAPAAMASGWTLAGVRQSGRHPAELPLAQAAIRMWQTLDSELGGPTHYRQDGNLRLARSEAEVGIIERMVVEQRDLGLDLQLLRGGEIGAVCGAIAPSVLAASFCGTDGHADPDATIAAYVAAARRAGVTWHFGEQVLAIETAGGRVCGVVTDAGPIAGKAVVVAAGVFGNALLNPLGLDVPLDIHMVTVLRSAPMQRVLRPVIGVANADCAGRQEVDGRFRVTNGAEPWHGRMDDTPRPRVHPSAASVARTIATFGAVVPDFCNAGLEAMWAGLIDLTPDALPVIDAPAAIPGLVVTMGFSGHGFCLGPVTGQIVADLVQGRTPGMPIAAFRIGRFAERAASASSVTLHG